MQLIMSDKFPEGSACLIVLVPHEQINAVSFSQLTYGRYLHEREILLGQHIRYIELSANPLFSHLIHGHVRQGPCHWSLVTYVGWLLLFIQQHCLSVHVRRSMILDCWDMNIGSIIDEGQPEVSHWLKLSRKLRAYWTLQWHHVVGISIRHVEL